MSICSQNNSEKEWPLEVAGLLVRTLSQFCLRDRKASPTLLLCAGPQDGCAGLRLLGVLSLHLAPRFLRSISLFLTHRLLVFNVTFCPGSCRCFDAVWVVGEHGWRGDWHALPVTSLPGSWKPPGLVHVQWPRTATRGLPSLLYWHAMGVQGPQLHLRTCHSDLSPLSLDGPPRLSLPGVRPPALLSGCF